MLVTPDASADGLAPAALPQPSMVFVGRMHGIANGPHAGMYLVRYPEAALTALAACPRMANSDRKNRDSLVEQAGYALWLFIVQREACGLNKIDHVMQELEPPTKPPQR
jgi:hypothetical protein